MTYIVLKAPLNSNQPTNPSTKTDVTKHESVTQKHMKSASHRTHSVVYTVSSVPFHGLQHTKDKITALVLLGESGEKYNK